jgi:hypothetical protein
MTSIVCLCKANERDAQILTFLRYLIIPLTAPMYFIGVGHVLANQFQCKSNFRTVATKAYIKLPTEAYGVLAISILSSWDEWVSFALGFTFGWIGTQIVSSPSYLNAPKYLGDILGRRVFTSQECDFYNLHIKANIA